MADENKAHLLKYTGQGLNSILDRADTVIKTAQDNAKYYIVPFNGGIGPEVPEGNSVLLGGDDKKINTVSSKPGAFYSSIEGRAPQFGTLPVQYGGTGVTTYSDLKKALGLGENTTGALKVENGGTGITNPTPNKILVTTPEATYGYIFPLAAGTVLVSNGPDELPTFKTIESISATTNFGTINTGEWKGSVIAPDYGGTGVNNLDDLSINLGLNTTTAPIAVTRGGTGVDNLNDLKKNLAIQFTDISMGDSIISEVNGGTGYNSIQAAFDDKIIINLASEKITNILPASKGGTGYNSLQDAFNNEIKNINLDNIAINGTLLISNGGTGGVNNAPEFRESFNIYSKEDVDTKINDIKNIINEAIPSIKVKETIIDYVANSKAYTSSEISDYNRILKTVNEVLDIEIILPVTDISNGTEIKIIKTGAGKVLINGTEIVNVVNNCIYIDNIWYF